MRNLSTYIIYSFALTLLFACSDINDGVAEKSDMSVEKRLREANCDIHPERFSEILSQDISSDIECAYTKVNLLIDLVHSEMPELDEKNVSRESLEKVINSKAQEAVGVLEYLDIFFLLNNFILGSADNFIEADDFLLLKNFLIVFNREVSKVYEYFLNHENPQGISLKEHQKIKKEIQKVAGNLISKVNHCDENNKCTNVSLVTMLERSSRFRHVLNLKDLFKAFEATPRAESLKFLKRFIIGGSPDELEHEEFLKFCKDKLLDGILVFYDFYKYEDLSFEIPTQRFELYHKILNDIEDLLPKGEDRATSFTLKELAHNIDLFLDQESLMIGNKELKLKNYLWEISRLKEIFLGTNSSDFTFLDVKKTINLVRDIIDIGKDFSVIYENNKNVLNNKKLKITSSTQLPVKGSLSHWDKNFKHFVWTLKNYRYLKGDNPIPTYDDFFHRDLSSLVLFGQIDYLLEIAIRYYEKKYPCDEEGPFWIYNPILGLNEYKKIPSSFRCDTGVDSEVEDNAATLAKNQIYLFVNEFRRLFYDLGVVTPYREDVAASNVGLIPDIFSYSAKNDFKIQRNELIEFVVNIVDGLKMSEDAFSYMSKKCPVLKTGDSEGLLTTCFRKNFYPFLFSRNQKGFRYIDYLPKFKAFYEQAIIDSARSNATREDKERLKRYLLLLDRYTKTCAYDNVPTTKSDILSVLTGLFSIEATLTRFDTKTVNNIVDVDEVEIAYDTHFKASIKNIVLNLISMNEEEEKPDNEDEKGWFSRIWGRVKDAVSDTFNSAVGRVLDSEEVYKVIFRYLVKNKKIPYPFNTEKLKEIAKDYFKYYRQHYPVDRETIAAVLVILDDLNKDMRKDIFNEIGGTYVPTDKFCRSRLSEGEDDFVEQEWNCIVDAKCR